MASESESELRFAKSTIAIAIRQSLRDRPPADPGSGFPLITELK